jgi:pimeloyl-ACP methyl ester carboxylesterase
MLHIDTFMPYIDSERHKNDNRFFFILYNFFSLFIIFQSSIHSYNTMSHTELLKMSLDNGVTLGYRLSRPIDKSRPTIIMFHSFLMDSRFFSKQFKDTRYADFNLIAVEAHGHGETTGRGASFTFWDNASDSLQLLTKLGVDRFYALGTSQGGFTALRIALLGPERIQGLILLGTTPYAIKEEFKIHAQKARDKWHETKIPSEEVILARTTSFGSPDRVGEKTFEKIKQMWLERYTGPEGYDPAFNCLINRDAIQDRLGEIKVPVLIIHGTEDKPCPAKDVSDWSSKLPNVWKVEIVERGTHYLSFVEPGDEVCARLVPEFIKATS